VQNVAHKAVETIQHGVEVAEEVGLSVVDTALGVKDTAIEKTSEYIEVGKEKAGEYYEAGKEMAGEYLEAGKEKAVQLSNDYQLKEKAASFTEQATAKAVEIKHVAEEYLEAGKEKAAPYIEAGKEKAAPYIEAGKEKAAPYIEAGKDAVVQLVGQAGEKVGEVRKATEEAIDAGKGKARSTKKARVEPKKQVAPEVAELIEKVHGDEVDATGHVVIAPENVKEGPASDYEGGWKTVGKDGHHNGLPHVDASLSGTPSK